MLKNSRTNILSTVDRTTGIILLIIVTIYFLCYIIPANADLSEGRYALFMDEQISLDGVKDILYPKSLGQFMESVLDGNDHRYGRILWNASALFSFIPELIHGEKGQIISTRMLHAMALMSSYLILAFTFVRTWSLRALLFLCLMGIPTTAYYSTMPKPEPLQLLFISLFLLKAKKHDFKFGPYWFFIGMAFGTKISGLFLILLFGAAALLQERSMVPSMPFRKKLLRTAVFTGIGFMVAEPIFLYSFSFSSVKRYLGFTFFNTGHGSDDLSVNWLTWLKYIFTEYTHVPLNLSIGAMALVLLLISLYIISKIQKAGTFKLDKDQTDNIGMLIVTAGFAMIFPIIFKVHRLWFFYLHTGIVLLLTGLVSYSELSIAKGINGRSASALTSLAAACALIMTLMITNIFYLIPQTNRMLAGMAERSRSEVHIKKTREYKYLIGFLDDMYVRIGRRLHTFYDPYIYLINSNEKYEITRFWGYFQDWEKEAEVVIFYNSLIVTDLPPKTSVEYEMCVNAKKLHAKYVCSMEKASASNELCYVLVESEMPDIRIFLRNDIYNNYYSG